MKKHQLKSYLKLGILLFGISYLFTNCEQESINTIENTQSKYKLSRVTANEIQKNISVSEKISSIENDILATKGNAKSNYENIQFSIDLNEATYIEATDGSYHSYTFGIYNEEDNYNLNNIVLSLTENGDYEADLVTYILTQDERNLIDNGIEIDLTNKTTIEPFDINQVNYYGKSGGTCVELVYVGTEDCSCHDTHASGGCTHPTDIYEWQSVPCDGSGGTSGGNDNGNDGSGFDGSSGSSGSGDTTQPKPKATSLKNPNGTQVRANIQKLTNLTNNIQIKDKITDLQAIVNSSVSETGTQFDVTNYTPLTFNEVTPLEASTNHTRFPDLRTNTLVNLHLHPKFGLFRNRNNQLVPRELSPIFSHVDLNFMLDFFEDTENLEITSLLVSVEGVFALKITDEERANFMENKLNKKRHWNNFSDEFYKKVLTAPEGQADYTNQEIIDNFIEFINNYKINNNDDDKGLGLTLYQATLDINGSLTGW